VKDWLCYSGKGGRPQNQTELALRSTLEKGRRVGQIRCHRSFPLALMVSTYPEPVCAIAVPAKGVPLLDAMFPPGDDTPVPAYLQRLHIEDPHVTVVR
jgi:hypothetical protein